MTTLKRLAARLPHRWQAELKRIHFGRQIDQNRFDTSEAEYRLLPELLHAGDWAIDVGANVGQYTKRFSDLVGPTGRVLAFEPVPATFALLAANAERFAHGNVSLFNAAVSDRMAVLGMAIPRFQTGLQNYYEAHLTPGAEAGVQVLTMNLDALAIAQRVALIKIDAEGHEAQVLAGMQRLIAESRPVLIVETGSVELIESLKRTGYTVERLAGSSNIVCRPS
jgi:FkbM family methyltransferase